MRALSDVSGLGRQRMGFRSPGGENNRGHRDGADGPGLSTRSHAQREGGKEHDGQDAPPTNRRADQRGSSSNDPGHGPAVTRSRISSMTRSEMPATWIRSSTER